MALKKRVTLYFTAESALSDKDIEAINHIPGGAFHRNASFISDTDKLEKCDAVAGPAIPQPYIDAGIPVVGDVDGDGDVDEDDFASMTVPQLKHIATDRGIEIPAGAKKADIIALLQPAE